MSTSLKNDAFKSLFCLANGSISGGNNVLYGIIQRLEKRNQIAKAFSPFADVIGKPNSVSLIAADSFSEALRDHYDFVFLSKPFMLPLALPHIRSGKAVYLALDHEEFDNPALQSTLALPVPIIATSKYIQQSLKTKSGRDSHFVPLAIDDSFFRPLAKHATHHCKRILMVGDYLLPLKGMVDGFDAIRKLAQELTVQLVLITQQDKQREIFKDLNFPVEIHYQPSREEVPKIYASCDVYMCSSWHENFPLPPLEAFSSGIPVASTLNHGVSDYGVDGVNLLLARIKDSEELYQKLKTILTDAELRDKLIANGFTTAQSYGWSNTMEMIVSCQETIQAEPPLPTFSEDELQPLLDELELNGCYTPNVVRKHCQQLFQRLNDKCRNLVALDANHEEIMPQVVELRNSLKPYLSNTGALYYRSVKRRYDLCQLLLGLSNDSAALRMAAMQEANRN